ncbi:MAG: AhpC/TSA family protein [Taibaiella sp.]|nr:AhpC/TSA family protein [Taibaiella sp.]
MKSKHLLFFLIAVTALAACSSKSNKFVVIGDITGMPKQTVLLEQLGANDIVALVDSVNSSEDGHFELSGAGAEPGLYRVHFSDNKFILLSLDKGNVKVTGDWSSIENYTVAGSPASEHLKQFLKFFREKVRDFNTMNIVLDTLRARGNDSLLAQAQKNYQEMNQEFTQLIETYADTASFEPNAVFAARILNPSSEAVFLGAFTQSLNKRFPGTRLTREFQEYFNRTNLKNPNSEHVKAQNIEAGMMAPEVNLPAPDGNNISLSSLRGKFVLLDFWASWCGPCRAENPNVVAAFNKFKDKNFTVYGVSLDHNKEKWEQAIKDDGLSWTQVSDLKGWSSVAATIYSIQSIPSNVLIGPDGKVIARNLRGSDLDEMLERVLSESGEQNAK